MILLHCLFVKTVHHQFCYLRHLPKKTTIKSNDIIKFLIPTTIAACNDARSSRQAVYNVVDELAYILRTLSLPPLATLSPSGLQSTENTLVCVLVGGSGQHCHMASSEENSWTKLSIVLKS